MKKLIGAGVTALATVVAATAGVASARAESTADGPRPCVIQNAGHNNINACRDVLNGSGHVAGNQHSINSTGDEVSLPDPALPFFRVGSTTTAYKITLAQKIGDFDPSPDTQTVLNGNGQLFWPTLGLTGAIYSITDSSNAFRGNASLTFDVRNPQNIIWRCETSADSPVSCSSPSGGQLDTIKLS
ncbi:hypothetical protein ACFC09_10110 [Streptomyces sp. NPDC056161]|uniref:hypothetical protein n=1 Tax=Streptomyces sp. NPDC056161 TaxID=3345732 RepID=UPI0035E0B3C9